MNVTDTAGNAVTGSVDLSAIAGSVDTRNTVTAGETLRWMKLLIQMEVLPIKLM